MLTLEYLEDKFKEISKIKDRCKSRTQSEIDYLVFLERLETAYQAEYEKALKRPRPIVIDGEVIPYWTKYGKEFI